MKTILLIVISLICLFDISQGAEVTLTVNNQAAGGATATSDQVTIGANEVGTVQSLYGWGGNGSLSVIKNGITNSLLTIDHLQSGDRLLPTVAGPATIRLSLSGGTSTWCCTVKTVPESFPPGQTLILPQGTVGIIHVESSTNLLQWQDEWVHTFSNTNENRFFRLRAERALP